MIILIKKLSTVNNFETNLMSTYKTNIDNETFTELRDVIQHCVGK